MGLFDTTATGKNYETTQVEKQIPNYAIQPIGTLFNQINDYLKSSPNQYITPINSIQQSIFGAAGASNDDLLQMSYSPTRQWLNPPAPEAYGGNQPSAFGGANQYYDEALDLTRNVADPALSQAGLPDRYNTANVSDIGDRGFVNADLGTLGNASRAGFTGYSAPQLGDAATWTGQGYDAALVGDVGRYLDGDIERAQSASLLDNFDAYLNPYLSDVVDTTLADFDEYAGTQRADLARRGAAAGAFGEGRFGLAEGQLEGELARGRASTAAGLRSDAYNNALGASNLDASRRQETGIFNAGQANSRDIERARLALESQGINADAINQARSFAANARNQSERDAATAQNEFQLRQAGLDEGAARFLAEASNLSERDFANALNEFALSRFSEESQTNRLNAQSENAALADTYAADRAAAEQNAAAENAARSQFYSTEADTERFNTAEANRNAETIARLGLDRAGQLGDLATQYGANTRADLQMQQDIGERLYELQQQRQLAPLQQIVTGAGLLDPALIEAITNQTVRTQGQSSQKQGGGLLGLASLFL